MQSNETDKLYLGQSAKWVVNGLFSVVIDYTKEFKYNKGKQHLTQNSKILTNTHYIYFNVCFSTFIFGPLNTLYKLLHYLTKNHSC